MFYTRLTSKAESLRSEQSVTATGTWDGGLWHSPVMATATGMTASGTSTRDDDDLWQSHATATLGDDTSQPHWVTT